MFKVGDLVRRKPSEPNWVPERGIIFAVRNEFIDLLTPTRGLVMGGGWLASRYELDVTKPASQPVKAPFLIGQRVRGSSYKPSCSKDAYERGLKVGTLLNNVTPDMQNGVVQIYLDKGESCYVFVSTLEHVTPDPDLNRINWDKPVQTRDGRAARILCTDLPGPNPIVAAIGDSVRIYRADGKYPNYPCDYDLVNVPEEQDTWLYMHQSRRNGNIVLGLHEEGWVPRENKLLAKKKITITEGEGMS